MPSEMASLSNSSWKNRAERPNQSTNNGDMTKTLCCLCEWMSEYVSW